MEVISKICVALIFVAIFAIPVLFIIFIIRACMRKSKKWFGIAAAICAGSIVPLALIGTFTDPSTYCEHEYSIVEEHAPTCTKRGRIVKFCSLCESESYEYIDKIAHEYSIVETIAPSCVKRGQTIKSCSVCEDENIEYIDKVDHTLVTDTVVSASCIKGGYMTERCSVCDYTHKTNTDSALGHDMKEVSRREATPEANGEIVYQCSRCDKTETKVINKLPKPEATNPPTEATKPVDTTEPPTTEATEPTDEWKGNTIKFDYLELSFGEYSFTTVDNMYSEHNGKPVVRIPVTITNLSSDAHSLNMFYYTLFGTSGSESPSLWAYFDDDVINAGDLMPGKSYTKYFHILYDGDGIYTIMFDDMWFDEETVEIKVVKEN